MNMGHPLLSVTSWVVKSFQPGIAIDKLLGAEIHLH